MSEIIELDSCQIIFRNFNVFGVNSKIDNQDSIEPAPETQSKSCVKLWAIVEIILA